jgi:hypothetical protein
MTDESKESIVPEFQVIKQIKELPVFEVFEDFK